MRHLPGTSWGQNLLSPAGRLQVVLVLVVQLWLLLLLHVHYLPWKLWLLLVLSRLLRRQRSLSTDNALW